VRLISLTILMLLCFPGAPLRAGAVPAFDLRIDFWVGLHHFLYVLGRAANGEADSGRDAVAGAPIDTVGFGAASAAERSAWGDDIALYRGDLSRRDALFDDDLVRASHALAGAGDAATLDGVAIDAELRRVLESAAGLYRRLWWPRHEAACGATRSDLSRQLSRHADPIGAFLARAWGREWPSAPIPVELSPYANWAGAYSTDRFGTLIVVSCLADGSSGALGLESIFHESLHQWDESLLARIDSVAKRANARTPRNLWHALIFYSAGEAVKGVIPLHVPYAVKNGMWERGGLAIFKPVLDRHWLGYLRGRTTFERAVNAILSELSG
jgi:hypothetical protein